MDISGLALVNQITLRLAAEGGDTPRYLAQDQSSGRIFLLPRKIALALWRLKAALAGAGAEARRMIAPDEARELYGFLGQLRAGREQERLQPRRFNPVFASVPLFELAPFQPFLRPWAERLVRPATLVVLVALMVVAVILGIRSDWAILEVYSNVFSLDAITTFGLLAPVLKLIHELGHALTATRYGVRLRAFGISFVGLYPMPFVDCSEADMTATRGQRIAISMAGIVVDVLVGLIAFVLWHFGAGSFWQVLVGHVFVYSTMNSILFNANPLVRMDGYHALVDLLRRRNLGSRASAAFADLRLWLVTTGIEGHYPAQPRHWALVTWSMASGLYRIRTLYSIGSSLLPRYFGLGMVILIWGAVVMFVVPKMADQRARARLSDAGRHRRAVVLTGLALTLCALAFVPLPDPLVIPVGPDLVGHYQFTTRTSGFLAEIAPGGPMAAGALVARFENATMQDRAEILNANAKGAWVAYQNARSDQPAKAELAAGQLQALTDQIAVNKRELAGLSLLTDAEGVFLPGRFDTLGTFMPSGTALGAYLPATGTVVLVGDFPERYVDKFMVGAEQAELRLGDRFVGLDPKAAALRTILQVDRATGTRSYEVIIPAPIAPAELAGKSGDLRLSFAPQPLWRHVQFWLTGLAAKFREAQISEREKV